MRGSSLSWSAQITPERASKLARRARLEVALFRGRSRGGPIFFGECGGEQALEFCDAAGSFQAVGQIFQFAAGAFLAERGAEAVQALSLPPLAAVLTERLSGKHEASHAATVVGVALPASL